MSRFRQDIEQRLAGETGLEAASLGAKALEDAIPKRRERCGVASDAEYVQYLESHPGELQALVEAIVVSETWFFRDREPFDFLRHYVQTEWIPAHPGQRLRGLSLPCATGEEAYSIAITLREAGLGADQYRVEAADISSSVLEKARAGAYGRNSFRGSRWDGDPRYFSPASEGLRVNAEIQRSLRFYQANILKDEEPPDPGACDFIFCRNLLIYLHAAARRQVVQKLDRCLAEGGLLFVGHAEMLPLFPRNYQPVRVPGVFAYQKTRLNQDLAAPAPAAAPPRAALPARPGPSPSPAVRAAAAAPEVQPPGVAESLAQAHRLADQGRLAEAASLCEAALKQPLAEAGLYSLLGILREREGQLDAAAALLNRALYLDADHYEALVHLSLLKARRGDAQAAERLRQRAARVHERRRSLP